MNNERYIIDPAAIDAAIQKIKIERDHAQEAMNDITREYAFLSDNMEGVAVTAGIEFQDTARKLFEKVNETIHELEMISLTFAANSVEIDRTGAAAIQNM